MMDRPGGKTIRSEGNASPTPAMERARSSASCVSSRRMNEQIHGRFQKYPLLTTKKLSIDLLFRRGKHHYRIYKRGVGVTPSKATRNSNQGSTSNCDRGIHQSLKTGPLPHWPQEGKGAASQLLRPASLSRKRHVGERSGQIAGEQVLLTSTSDAMVCPRSSR